MLLLDSQDFDASFSLIEAVYRSYEYDVNCCVANTGRHA